MFNILSKKCLELWHFQDCNCTVVIGSNSGRVQDLKFSSFFFSDPDHIKIQQDEKISSRSLFYYNLSTKY